MSFKLDEDKQKKSISPFYIYSINSYEQSVFQLSMLAPSSKETEWTMV